MDLPKALLDLTDAIIDSYFIVDRNRTIVRFNAAFRALLPRPAARNLVGKKCYEVLRLEICEDRCIAEQCWACNGNVRLDEISGRVDDSGDLRFILSAIPVRNSRGEVVGALEIQRNVTDEAAVQKKYQQHVEAASSQIDALNENLAARTRRLLEVSKTLSETERALLNSLTELL